MAKVVVENGCLLLVTQDGTVPLDAETIFSLVFEGVEMPHGIAVSRADIMATGLEFREILADPVVVLEADSSRQLHSVLCRFVAKGIGFEAEVSKCGIRFLDYAVDADAWMPLPQGSLDAATEFLRQVGLSDFGSISLSQYLHILKVPTSAINIEDRTLGAFSSTHLSSALQGDPPAGFAGSLYPYQLAGYRWLSYMRNNGLGCIIADEMGLGKTVQVICLILDAKRQKRVHCLVLAPATLLENWRREILRFAPELRVCLHRGAQRTGFPEDLHHCDVVISSYETAVADVFLLRNLTWDLLIIDEAQAIKNPEAKRTRRLKTVPRLCTVAMSGTPVENRLSDIWSITDFVVPSLLGSLTDFERKHPDNLAGATALEPILTPIILRRRVSEVAQDLPERIDIPQPLELDEESVSVYEALRQSAAEGHAASLASIVKLRMFCTHPWLTGQFSHIAAPEDCSIKLKRLFEIMEEIVSDGGKALVFTSFQKSIDLLTGELASGFGIQTAAIDGRTSVDSRQKIVDCFASLTQPSVLVLNPKAAGTGLNITAANHVIHFNLEWNPAVEDQATARAHRRGQRRAVTVHRFFYVNTVEDVINDRMERKRQLASAAVIGTDGQDDEMEDIMRALRASPVNRQKPGAESHANN